MLPVHISEFDAHLEMALALARQLKSKLIKWGERMECSRDSSPRNFVQKKSEKPN